MSSITPLLKPDVTLSLALSSASPSPYETQERGIRLIQLLLKCANDASSGNLHRADACLSEISELSSVSGDSMQRLAARFASALAIRLVKRWPGLYKALNHEAQQPQVNLDRVRPLFARALPYLSFAYAIIARTLLQAMTHEHTIHIVDLGSGDSKLWVPLLRSLAHSPNGSPHLKFTCLNTDKAILDKLGQRLVKEAEASDMAFQFHPLNISLRDLTADMLQVASGEALAFISILNLHLLLAEDDRVDAHFGGNRSTCIKDCKQMSDFLAMVRSMSPRLLFLVEQEADHNLNRLPDRFIEGLHYYSAVFDSIDATLVGNLGSEDRMVLEEMFGREIENIVACEGLERYERHERCGKWGMRLARAGFKPVQMWCNFEQEAKQMVEAFAKGYKTVSERWSLMICWHERPIYAVTAWTC
ncbi:scarecrow-like protein 3 [Ricinus communis]|uniref:DELLA protein SLR1, putative n=1 Tax=Ricinus communis TaxID=3988 RepID=B9SIU3_RICCO|nr:scarecrow-like protein 3 [Ricinus communis]EEF36432.1 DELLA protein SLR1, putative [Ricinus communis]|eukprot:XP_002525912.1 scarecrow-like protein 3 [Ricinus communis]